MEDWLRQPYILLLGTSTCGWSVQLGTWGETGFKGLCAGCGCTAWCTSEVELSR